MSTNQTGQHFLRNSQAPHEFFYFYGPAYNSIITLNMYQLNHLMVESCFLSTKKKNKKKSTINEDQILLMIYKKRQLELVFIEIIQKDPKTL